MNKLIEYFRGSVIFEIIGGRGEHLLNACAEKGIVLEQIQPTPLGFTAACTLKNYKKLHRTARKFRCRLKIKQKKGIYFKYFLFRHRWGIPAGLIFVIFLMTSFQNLVWNITFYNFTPQQEAETRRKLVEKGVYEGCFQNPQKLVRTAGELFTESDDYGNISLNFIRGRLIVEKTENRKKPELVSTEYTDIIAESDGYIKQVHLMGGYPKAKTGQYVAKGDLLVSGRTVSEYGFPYYTHADAEVQAILEKTYQCILPMQNRIQSPQGKIRRYYNWHMPWGVWKMHGKIDQQENAICRRYRYPAAPLGFHLPVLVEEIEIRPLKSVAISYTEKQAETIARAKILDRIRKDYGKFSILSEHKNCRILDHNMILTLQIRMEADIARTVPGAKADDIASMKK